MTPLEKVQKAIYLVNYALDYKFITAPVRTSLEEIKTLLQSIEADLS